MSRHAFSLDYYELTMANSYWAQGRSSEWGVFDYYFRRTPDHGGYAIFAGLTQLLEFITGLHFSDQEIAFLRGKKIFHEGFLDYLHDFRFEGKIYAFPEGSVIFPNEPVITVRAPLIACQIIETFLLLCINHQSLVATKAARICKEAHGRTVMEFGSRRAHGADAALYGARAAYIGGVTGTANVAAGMRFGIPIFGTMAHAYVQSFASEYEAFVAYARSYPENTIVLVDTYHTLDQGIPNAIRLHREVLAPEGHVLKGIRIDSGDLAYLSNRTRKMLDAAGMRETRIIVSNALDEFLIKDLISQKAAIDGFGVGERLITAGSDPVFGGVYKIVAIEKDGRQIAKIKISDNVIKTTTPGFKQVYRLYDAKEMAIADLVTLRDERLDASEPYLLFDPEHPWKQKRIDAFRAEAMLNLVWEGARPVATVPTLEDARTRAQSDMAALWPEVKRLENPHGYYVDLSRKLWQLKQTLLERHKGAQAS